MPLVIYQVIHPLDDEPERKCNPDVLGPMHRTLAARIALFALRGYLMLMVLLLVYELLRRAGCHK